MKKRIIQSMAVCLALAAFLAAGAFAQNKYSKPKTILHIVTLYFKDGTTDEQKKAVYDGIEKMAQEIAGVKNVWLKAPKVQGSYEQRDPAGKVIKTFRYTDAFVMEFENQEALDKYADHPAHKEWEKIYLTVRGRSTSHQVTN